MTREIYTAKDNGMKVLRADDWCDECGQRAYCVKFETDASDLTLCIPHLANLMHFIIAGRKYEP